MNNRAEVKRQDRMDAEASPNVSMQRLASSLEREQRSLQLSRILIFLFVLTWLSLLFGRSLMRQARILDQVYDNAAKDNRIQQLRMSNAQLQEEIYSRTDLQAIAQAAIELGMIPAIEAPRILIPQTKNDEVLLRLESADADSFIERSQSGRETYYNLEEYYEEHRLAQAYFSNFEAAGFASEQELEEFVTSSQIVNEDGGIILDGTVTEPGDDASVVEGTDTDTDTTADTTADTNTSTNSETTDSATDDGVDELVQDEPVTDESSSGEEINEVIDE